MSYSVNRIVAPVPETLTYLYYKSTYVVILLRIWVVVPIALEKAINAIVLGVIFLYAEASLILWMLFCNFVRWI